MSYTLFISDLHLHDGSHLRNKLVHQLLQGPALACDALYILGDLFEAWPGDDDNSNIAQTLRTDLRFLTTRGIPVYLMRGNRDFLLGQRFCQAAGATLLADPSVIDLYGVATLLMHGDTLDANDQAYLWYRWAIQSNPARVIARCLPLRWRLKLAKQLRRLSEARGKQYIFRDFVLQTLVTQLQRHHATQLIHGHTHHPTIQHFQSDLSRYVLSDWTDTACGLCVYADGRKRLGAIDHLLETAEL